MKLSSLNCIIYVELSSSLSDCVDVVAEHVEDKHPLIYLLIHSDTYYSKHFYE